MDESQRGVGAAQLRSLAQAAHIFPTQYGPTGDVAQPLPSSHWAHQPSSQIGAAAEHSAEVVHEGAQRWPWQTVPAPQSVVALHSTQRLRAVSHRGRPGVVQWASVEQATQTPPLPQ